MGSAVKNPLSMQETQETWLPSLGQEDPLEKEMATHSNILAWRIPWTEDPGRLKHMVLLKNEGNYASLDHPELAIRLVSRPRLVH